MENETNKAVSPEGWVTKQQLADFYKFSTKWVEGRVNMGLPCAQFGRHKRFRISDCESWFQENGYS